MRACYYQNQHSYKWETGSKYVFYQSNQLDWPFLSFGFPRVYKTASYTHNTHDRSDSFPVFYYYTYRLLFWPNLLLFSFFFSSDSGEFIISSTRPLKQFVLNFYYWQNHFIPHLILKWQCPRPRPQPAFIYILNYTCNWIW